MEPRKAWLRSKRLKRNESETDSGSNLPNPKRKKIVVGSVYDLQIFETGVILVFLTDVIRQRALPQNGRNHLIDRNLTSNLVAVMTSVNDRSCRQTRSSPSPVASMRANHAVNSTKQF
jgi:hypothetical protein